MIEKPKRPKKIPNQDNKQPQTIQELIRRYDLDNTKIYDFLDELVGEQNQMQSNIENALITKAEIVYKKTIVGGNTDAYTFSDIGLYLVLGHSNGDDYCVFDVVLVHGTNTLYSTRIKDKTQLSTTYEGTTVTMSPTYVSNYIILKL